MTVSSQPATPSDRPPPLLVFDFDGVLCDSLEECMMVAWYAYKSKPVGHFLDPALEGVPPEVLERFQRCRPFMRHLGHFLLPLVVTSDLPTTHAGFAAQYQALPPADVERFADAANDYRKKLRSEHAEPWHARHTVQDELRELVAGAYIATARDSASVGHILRAHGFEVDDGRVFGSLRDKTDALTQVAARESRDPADVVLVDDSVENCVAARKAGFGAYWATWGYHAEGDAGTAERHKIPALSVEDLLRMPAATLTAP